MISSVNDLRKSFLDFFESKEHLVMPSFSLVPQNDKSLLLINAGMAPLKPYFTGQETPPKTRVCTCQKCIRTGDIENVGKTARHLTFFEMLGNFSFGDYFKHEAIAWSWEYLTKVLGIPEDRLYPSVYGEDDEAFDIWNREIGIDAARIKKFFRDPETGECDNFWEHGAGPCGPCSEIYYDRGEKYGCGKPDCGVGCECDRFIEVWNNVFTQFEGDGKGGYTELKKKNIDTGMGLERLAVVMQDVDSVFDIDTMKAIRDKICAMSQKEYKKNYDDDVSIRLITDHIRSATFMVSDGILPSNEGRGYVLRRLIRRAAHHGRRLGIDGMFLSELSGTVISESADGYPELSEKESFIYKVLSEEEKRFAKTIDQGSAILSDYIQKLKDNGSKKLSGEDAFKLFDTFGFPLDLTEEILAEQGMSVDLDGFDSAMKQQKETARAARKQTNYMGKESSVYDTLSKDISTCFVGYDNLSFDSKIEIITADDEVVEKASAGTKATVITDDTPFYGTMGGQNGDMGRIITAGNAVFTVEDTIHLPGDKVGHVGEVSEGEIAVGDKVTLCVDKRRRADIARNHSATHLLQRALKEVLGDHVQQAGSDVSDKRLRFDFTHFSAMTPDQICDVEKLVNDRIAAAVDVKTSVMSLDEAKKTGAMMLFGEKYGDEVRVVSMGEYSTELCGGTHVKNTSDIVRIKITSEGGVASGVRRIEAITGSAVFDYYTDMEKELNDAAALLKTNPAGVSKKVSQILAELKDSRSEIEALKAAMRKDAAGDIMDKAVDVSGVKLIAADFKDIDQNGLRDLGDQIKDKLGEGVIVLISDNGGKVALVAMATDGAVKSGAHAGNIVREVAKCVGGGGGGRPNMAQAGGKNPAGIPEALAKAAEVLGSQVG